MLSLCVGVQVSEAIAPRPVGSPGVAIFPSGRDSSDTYGYSNSWSISLSYYPALFFPWAQSHYLHTGLHGNHWFFSQDGPMGHEPHRRPSRCKSFSMNVKKPNSLFNFSLGHACMDVKIVIRPYCGSDPKPDTPVIENCKSWSLLLKS